MSHSAVPAALDSLKGVDGIFSGAKAWFQNSCFFQDTKAEPTGKYERKDSHASPCCRSSSAAFIRPGNLHPAQHPAA